MSGLAPGFRDALEVLINRYSVENGSNTPDFILKNFLVSCLEAFDAATNNRDRWYGKPKKPGQRKATSP